jgi:hypothetical protein
VFGTDTVLFVLLSRDVLAPEPRGTAICLPG